MCCASARAKQEDGGGGGGGEGLFATIAWSSTPAVNTCCASFSSFLFSGMNIYITFYPLPSQLRNCQSCHTMHPSSITPHGFTAHTHC